MRIRSIFISTTPAKLGVQIVRKNHLIEQALRRHRENFADGNVDREGDEESEVPVETVDGRVAVERGDDGVEETRAVMAWPGSRGK